MKYESVDVRPLALTNFSLISSQFLISEIASCTSALCDTTLSTGTVCTRPQLTKAFSPTTASVGSGSTVVFTITNGTDSPKQDGIAFTDTLPTNLIVSNSPNIQTNCPAGGALGSASFTVSAAVGSSAISVKGASINSGVGSCQLQVNVTSATPGDYTNTSASMSGMANIDNAVTASTLTLQP